MERHDTNPGHPHRFGFVDVYSHDNGRTWGAENGHYDLTYDDALRHLARALTRLLPPPPTETITDHQLAGAHRVAGRDLDITRTSQTSTHDVAYNIVDRQSAVRLTGIPLDTFPTPETVRAHIDQLVTAHNDATLEQVLDPLAVQRFLQALPTYITISLDIDNTYERYPDVTTHIVDRIIPAPPNYAVGYEILTEIDTGEVLAAGRVFLNAYDHGEVGDLAPALIKNTDPRYDSRIQPAITITSIEAIEEDIDPESGDEWAQWRETHIHALTGTEREDGDSWYDVTVTACSNPALIGKTFTFGY